MTSRVEVHAEGVPVGCAGLHRVFGSSEGEQVGFDRVDVVDGQVEVELLRPFTSRPRRRGVVVGQLERDPPTVDGEYDPIVLGGGDLPADDALVELRERAGVRAVQDHGAHASKCHGRKVSQQPIRIARFGWCTCSGAVQSLCRPVVRWTRPPNNSANPSRHNAIPIHTETRTFDRGPVAARGAADELAALDDGAALDVRAIDETVDEAGAVDVAAAAATLFKVTARVLPPPSNGSVTGDDGSKVVVNPATAVWVRVYAHEVVLVVSV